MSTSSSKIPVKVTKVTEVNEFVKHFRLEALNGTKLPTFSGGSHTVVEMNDNGTQRLNPYSLLSDPFDTEAYEIAVRREDEGRGGSLFMHKNVTEGTELTITTPVNLFSLDLRARKTLMIAGGIGITPFMSQIKQLEASGGYFELHYATRSRQLASFADHLKASYPDNVNLYFDDEGLTIDLLDLLSKQPIGTHLFTCGPKGMSEAVLKTAKELGWPDDAVHYEELLAPQPGKPFEVELTKSGKSIQVGEDQSLLEALEANDVDVPYLCRGGACGQCETKVAKADGEIIHHDHWLSEEDKASGTKIMPCVSRLEGKCLSLEL